MAFTVILAIGLDQMVLSTRCSILESAGYIVRSTCSVAESIDLFQSTDFDLVLLCHSIPVLDRDRLIRFVRSTDSRTLIYAVESAATDFKAGLADGILSSRPGDLIRQLGDVIEFAPRTTAHAACQESKPII